MRICVTFPLLLLVAWKPHPCSTACVMRGLCHRYTTNAVAPCYLNDTHDHSSIHVSRAEHPHEFHVLAQHCPHLVDSDAQSARLCCNAEQILGMADSLRLAQQILGRCPSCFHNFAKLWCQFSCSPDQSRFMKILESRNESVYRARFSISTRFANGLYASCRHVQFAGSQALRLMTIHPGTGQVSLNEWFEYMGTQNIPNLVPIFTDFVFGDPTTSMDIPFTECHRPISPNEPACSVVDCKRDEGEVTRVLDFGNLRRISFNVLDFDLPTLDWYLKLISCVVLTNLIVIALKLSCHGKPIAGKRRSTVCYMDAAGPIELVFEQTCDWYANTVIRYPWRCVLLGFLIAAICCSGNVHFKSRQHSVDQTSSEDSPARIHHSMMIRYFGPFKRIQQVIVDIGNMTDSPEPIFNKTVLIELFDLVKSIETLKVKVKDRNVSLDEICFKPLGNHTKCTILSATNYFQNEKSRMVNARVVESDDDVFDTDPAEPYEQHLASCIRQPLSVSTVAGISCHGGFGGPVEPRIVFGGYKVSETSQTRYFSSNATIITIPILGDDQEAAMEWEKGFLAMMADYEQKVSSRIKMTYMAETSIDLEINREVDNDKYVSILACAMVLVWVFTNLGKYYWPEKSVFSIGVHLKLVVATTSVLWSCISTWCAIGVFSYYGLHASGNALVVLFFIVASIGINRCFVTVRGFQANGNCFGPACIEREEIETRIVEVMTRCIPIISTSSMICSICFLLAGGAPFIGIKMPVIEVFSRHVALAVFFDTLFYLLIGLPLFQYDAKRELQGRSELWPWYELRDATKNEMCVEAARFGIISLVDLFKSHVAQLILVKRVRIAVCVTFVLSLIYSTYCALKLQNGFDQTMTFSKETYLRKHLENIQHNMNIGPPVYFVILGDVGWNDPRIYKKFCTLPGCDEQSMGNTLRSLASLPPDSRDAYFTGDVFIWIDTFLQFVDPRGACCRRRGNGGSFCNSTLAECGACVKQTTSISDEQFEELLKHFIDTPPNMKCAHGGRATARNEISIDNGKIKASYFWTFFNKMNLTNSMELFDAMNFARYVASEMEARIGINGVSVFTYSQFFPYYEQYYSISQTLYTLVLIVLFVLFVTTFLFLKVDFVGAIVTVFILFSTFLHMLAWMYLWGIQMNVLSATNMAMSLGIAVEFMIQVLHGFYNSTKPRSSERAMSTIARNGSTILSGLLPTIVLTAATLGFADSQILKIYFGYQLLGVAFICTTHAIIYYPVGLAVFSQNTYEVLQQNEEQLERI